MIRDAEESRSGQFRPITCEIATSDPHVLNPCCQGVGHAFNFDQSQVKSQEGLTCVRVCVLQARVCDKVDQVFFSPCVFLTRSTVFFSGSLSIHQSVRVFDKVHCLFCKLEH